MENLKLMALTVSRLEAEVAEQLGLILQSQGKPLEVIAKDHPQERLVFAEQANRRLAKLLESNKSCLVKVKVFCQNQAVELQETGRVWQKSNEYIAEMLQEIQGVSQFLASELNLVADFNASFVREAFSDGKFDTEVGFFRASVEAMARKTQEKTIQFYVDKKYTAGGDLDSLVQGCQKSVARIEKIFYEAKGAQVAANTKLDEAIGRVELRIQNFRTKLEMSLDELGGEVGSWRREREVLVKRAEKNKMLVKEVYEKLKEERLRSQFILQKLWNFGVRVESVLTKRVGVLEAKVTQELQKAHEKHINIVSKLVKMGIQVLKNHKVNFSGAKDAGRGSSFDAHQASLGMKKPLRNDAVSGPSTPASPAGPQGPNPPDEKFPTTFKINHLKNFLHRDSLMVQESSVSNPSVSTTPRRHAKRLFDFRILRVPHRPEKSEPINPPKYSEDSYDIVQRNNSSPIKAVSIDLSQMLSQDLSGGRLSGSGQPGAIKRTQSQFRPKTDMSRSQQLEAREDSLPSKVLYSYDSVSEDVERKANSLFLAETLGRQDSDPTIRNINNLLKDLMENGQQMQKQNATKLAEILNFSQTKGPKNSDLSIGRSDKAPSGKEFSTVFGYIFCRMDQFQCVWEENLRAAFQKIRVLKARMSHLLIKKIHQPPGAGQTDDTLTLQDCSRSLLQRKLLVGPTSKQFLSESRYDHSPNKSETSVIEVTAKIRELRNFPILRQSKILNESDALVLALKDNQILELKNFLSGVQSKPNHRISFDQASNFGSVPKGEKGDSQQLRESLLRELIHPDAAHGSQRPSMFETFCLTNSNVFGGSSHFSEANNKRGSERSPGEDHQSPKILSPSPHSVPAKSGESPFFLDAKGSKSYQELLDENWKLNRKIELIQRNNAAFKQKCLKRFSFRIEKIKYFVKIQVEYFEELFAGLTTIKLKEFRKQLTDKLVSAAEPPVPKAPRGVLAIAPCIHLLTHLKSPVFENQEVLSNVRSIEQSDPPASQTFVQMDDSGRLLLSNKNRESENDNADSLRLEVIDGSPHLLIPEEEADQLE